jgi:hypothetical protein
VTVSASATSVPPGGTILFGVSASAASWEAGEIATTLTPSEKTPVFSPPEFTIAGCTCHPASASYELTLPAGQPAGPQITARVSVPKTAPAGETIQFSASVSVASGGGSALTAAASAPTVTVATAPASPSPVSSPKSGAASSPGSTSGGSTSGGSISGGLGGTTPSALGTASGLGAALPSGALPTIGAGTPGRTINVPAGSAANLFPQINPSTGHSHAPKTGRANPGQDAVAAAATNPISLTGAQFGSQIIGLIVLLLGVAVVATGISMRKVRTIGKPST